MSMDVAAPGKKRGAMVDINVTPLIDVVLVLLIIFMVLVPSMLKEITANVPKKVEDNTPPDPSQTPIVLEYTATGELLLNTEPLAPEALADKIKERLKHARLKVVFFKVDDEASYGKTVRFMDIVKGVGGRIGIMTNN